MFLQKYEKSSERVIKNKKRANSNELTLEFNRINY
jgi:hypothetical protein